MVDWSKIFNIAFVAGAGALTLFLLVSTIAVAVKGKRRCNAFDVILRIASTLAFIASTAMFAAAVLCMLSGPVRIAAEPEPTLFFNDFSYVLPLPDLFVLLATTVGSEIAIALFLCSLVALIVDCLVANKKSDRKKSKQPAVKKSPEQLKREAELARIRKIGESAVKKTSDAARVAEAQAKQAQPEKNASEEAAAEAAAPAADWREPTQDAREQAPDWREPPQEQPAQFVGLNTDTNSDFDSFDTFDDVAEEQPEEDIIEEVPEEQSEEEIVEEVVEEQSEEEIVEEVVEEQPEEEIVEEVAEEQPEEDVIEEVVEEQPEEEIVEEVAEEQPEEDVIEEVVEEQPEEDIIEEVVEEQPEEEIVEEVVEEQPEEEIVEEVAEEPRAAAVEQPDYGDIEPDRDIYIPEIRTINKPTDDDPELKPSKKPTPRKSGGARQPAKSGAKKPAAKKPAASGKKPSSGGAARKPAAARETPRQRPAAAEIPEEKKLPVTRRYVILDRRNAVNMFGEYLRERNKADKEKLQSSINTIIIE